MIPHLFAIFLTVFLAELGDKTQLATMLYASDGGLSRWQVFFAASAALVTSTALAVLAGTFAAVYLQRIPLKLLAGVGFVLVGAWTIAGHFRAG